MAATTGAVLSGVGSLVGAGASIIGGANASDAAESAADSSSETAQNNAMLKMLGFYASKKTLEDAAQEGRHAQLQGRLDQDSALNESLRVLSGSENYWNDAYNTGRGDLTAGLNEWDNKYNQVRADEANYMALGEQGLAGYSGLLKDPSSITTNPGYQFRLDQGVQGLDRSAAAKGKLFSGAQGKAVTEYGQNYATNEYDKALARYQQAINTGQTAVSQVNQAGMTTAAGKGQLFGKLADLSGKWAEQRANGNALRSQVYQNWGDDMWNVAKGNTALETGLADDVVQAWQDASNNTTSSNTSNNNTAAQATTAGASAQNDALEGVGNSINSGITNYLKSSSYGSGNGGIGSIGGGLTRK